MLAALQALNTESPRSPTQAETLAKPADLETAHGDLVEQRGVTATTGHERGGRSASPSRLDTARPAH